MNVIFGFVLILSTIIMLFTSPNDILKSMLAGGTEALTLTIKLTAVYAVWLGIFALLEKTGIDKKASKLLHPFNKKLFGPLTTKQNEYMSLNIASNILGISGATTPMGIKSINELENSPNTEYQIAMFFVINATSVQLIPSSILALRTSMGATNPADIILPTILSTLISSIVGIVLVKLFIRKK